MTASKRERCFAGARRCLSDASRRDGSCMRIITALCYCLLRAMADDDETHFEIRRVQYGRMPLGPDQLFLSRA